MKKLLTSIVTGSMLASLAIAQPAKLHYTVIDLGTLPGGKFSQATFVNNSGVVAGIAALADGTQHAVLWQKGQIKDIGVPGAGGPGSGAFGVNDKGQALVQAESAAKDPNSENFCAYNTGLACLPFLWQDGVLTPLPTLGGKNATVGTINNLGEMAGIAENSTRDPNCPAGMLVTGTGPQVLDYEAVIWSPKGEIRVLRPLAGDTVGMALAINDKGQAVGTTGTCANTVYPPVAAGPHAVLWESDGSVVDLGNLGGTVNTAVQAVGNIGLGINNLGQVVGASALPGNTTAHGFLWTREKGMRDLGTFPGDGASVGFSINDNGDLVGVSFGENGPRPYLWQNGVMTDVNTVIPAGFPLHLLFASAINNRGEIAGFGVTETGESHAYLASPAGTTASAGPKNTTVIARQITLDGTASFSADGKPLTYQWSIPQGSPQAAILHGTTASPEVQFASGRNVYQFQLTVTDSTGTLASDIVSVNFQGN